MGEPVSGRGRRALRITGAVAVWLPLVLLAAWIVVRLAGTEAGYPLVPLLAFTPYVAAVSVVPLILAAALRRWIAVGLAVLLASLFAAAVLPRALAGGTPEADGPGLRMLTTNLLVGRADPGAVVELVRRNRTDVLTVQELTPDMVTRLRDSGLENDLPHTVLRPAQTPDGPGIYSRFPLEFLADLNGIPGRVQIHVRLLLPDGPAVEVVAVHPPPPSSPSNVRAWEASLRVLPTADRRGPVRILSGDFNATLDHAALRAVLNRGYTDAAAAVGAGLYPTWPVLRRYPPVTIDHILVDRRVGVRDVGVHPLRGSDHRALAAELRLPR